MSNDNIQNTPVTPTPAPQPAPTPQPTPAPEPKPAVTAPSAAAPAKAIDKNIILYAAGGLIVLIIIIGLVLNGKGKAGTADTYASPAKTTVAAPVVTILEVTGDRVCVRKAPSLEGEVLGHVSKLDTVEFTVTSENYQAPWKQVKVTGQELTGWIREDFLKAKN